MAIFNKSASTKHSTIIGADAFIKGDLYLKSMIYIDGKIEGNIDSLDAVVVGKNSIITGNIKANKVVINGQIIGNIDANNIDILAGAQFVGDMEVFKLTCEPSGKFIGYCKYREEKKVLAENLGFNIENLEKKDDLAENVIKNSNIENKN